MSQPEPNARLTYELGPAILDAYYHGLFGKVCRPEIGALVFAASVQIIFADRQELWLQLEDSRHFNWLRLGVEEFVQIDSWGCPGLMDRSIGVTP